MRGFAGIASLILTVCLCLSGCTSATDNSQNGVVVTASLAGKQALVGDIPCAFPLAKGAATLSILSSTHGDTNYDDVYVWKKYEEMTGVDVKWTTVERSKRA